MGNPNRFESQIFPKLSCRGPKYRRIFIDLLEFSMKYQYYRRFGRAACKIFKGCRLPMAGLKFRVKIELQ
jgi:hypothetical protein